MRRAVPFLLAVTTLLAIAHSAGADERPQLIDASGMLDYMGTHNYHVGSWVKYHVQSSSLQGYEDDYTVTVLEAGEEVFWGEPCFWVETWTERKAAPPHYAASLISFAALGDTMAVRHPIWFTRKMIEGVDKDGELDESIVRRQAGELKLRAVNWEQEHRDTWIYRDTLGIDTTTVPAGAFKGLKLRVLRPWSETVDKGDSSIYYERRETRTLYYADEIPLTGFVRMDIDDVQKGRTWPIGQSGQKDLNILERAQGSAVLIGYGSSGVTPLLVPESRRHSVDRGLTHERPPTRATHPPGKRPAGKG